MMATLRVCSAATIAWSTLAVAVQMSGPIDFIKHTIFGQDGSNQKVFAMPLENNGDVQYTGSITVGTSELRTIIDTGSFELLVFGVNCTMCGSSKVLYDGTKSRKYVNNAFVGEHTFGSGKTYSTEVMDRISVADIEVPKQVFWEVTGASTQVLPDDSFQAILGIGPPGSVLKFAQDEDEAVHKELKKYGKAHKSVPQKVLVVSQHYDEEMIHAQNTTSVIENLGVERMSICLGKETGSSGTFLWNDNAAKRSHWKFTELSVVGDAYWSTELTNVGWGDRYVPENASKTYAQKAAAKLVSCSSKCSAIIDTGSSLIVAPKKPAQEIIGMVNDWLAAGGSCEDVSQLPDIEFQLNGVNFTLPPEAYVGRLDGELPSAMQGYMPKLYRKQKHGSLLESAGCQALILSHDVKTSEETWIFGMPFFRKYYTTFHYAKHIGKLSVPEPKTLAFAEADQHCKPKISPAVMAVRNQKAKAKMIEKKRSMPMPKPRPAQLHIDARKIRVSAFIETLNDLASVGR